MKHFFLRSDQKYPVDTGPGNSLGPSEEIPEPLYPYEHDVNTRDGSVPPDDNLLVKVQPRGNTGIEKTNSPGNRG